MTHELCQRVVLAVVSKVQGSQDRSKLVQYLKHYLQVLSLLEHSQQSWREGKELACNNYCK